MATIQVREQSPNKSDDRPHKRHAGGGNYLFALLLKDYTMKNPYLSHIPHRTSPAHIPHFLCSSSPTLDSSTLCFSIHRRKATVCLGDMALRNLEQASSNTECFLVMAVWSTSVSCRLSCNFSSRLKMRCLSRMSMQARMGRDGHRR